MAEGARRDSEKETAWRRGRKGGRESFTAVSLHRRRVADPTADRRSSVEIRRPLLRRIARRHKPIHAGQPPAPSTIRPPANPTIVSSSRLAQDAGEFWHSKRPDSPTRTGPE